ncbi:Hypothetical protein, putative [Bodo saltans]|uniref:Uncharacterized protein n=1 Tax=Bodo saltans TaxID=75058 RepID=A0A0S4JAZ8_BODSA|nr:Hypothetical protein, putative [Bodo saltans]|eukprot:CUG86324.1 Hypothetical protein, putative [Bodo saltans]
MSHLSVSTNASCCISCTHPSFSYASKFDHFAATRSSGKNKETQKNDKMHVNAHFVITLNFKLREGGKPVT